MRSYTTLGTGKATKVLTVADHFPARTVTTCTSDAAHAVARALEATDRQIPAALYQLAVALDGSPVEARRHLLGLYDDVVAGTDPDIPLDHWHDARTLVARVGYAVESQPAAVTAAVRKELADHLAGLDGVLVPARAVAGSYKRAHLDVCISGVLDEDTWWDYLLGPHGEVDVADDDDLFPVGGTLVVSPEFYELVQSLYHAEPSGRDWDFGAMGMRQLVDYAGEDGLVDLLIRADHLLAWVAHHRPDNEPRLRSTLHR